MASITARDMTLAEFVQNQERHVQDMMDRLGRMHVQRAESLLKQRPFCFQPSTATKVAEGVVLNGEILMSNAEDSDDEDEANWINDIGSEYAQILRVAVLLIQAPVEEDTRPLEIDTESRDMQYKNFVKIHPELNQENPQIHKEPTKIVHNYKEMQTEILDFIMKYGSRAVIASVIFNGHGTENGLRFHKHEDGDEVPLDTVIEDLKNVVKANRSALELPDTVELIFSQCFAHLHKPADSPDFTVYEFTNEKVEKTYVKESRDPLSQDVVDAHHLKLESHVPVSQEKWAGADQLYREKLGEGKKMIPDVDDGPATSVGGLVEDISELEIESFDG